MEKNGYVRIKPEYLLRGWKGLPYALVKRGGGRPYFMKPNVFRTVQFCNGRFTADSPVFIGGGKEHLAELDKFGLIEYLDEPGNLLPDQEYRFFDNRYLTRVHWSLTGHCNYRCRHCYMSAPHAALPHPTTEQCLDIADQIADCGIMRVSLTGGEPLIRKDFLKIVDRILERGMRIDVIMTNGALVDEALLDALDARDCHPELNMSFDGPKPWHDWLRGVEGAHESVRRALALCHERGFVTGTELVLHKGNIGTLRESVNMLGELGVSSLKVNRLNCVGEGEALSEYALTAQEEFEAYLDYIPHYLEDGMPVPILSLSGVFRAFEGELSVGAERNPEDGDCGRLPICASARTTMYLGPDGRILPCIPMSERDTTSELFPQVGSTTLAEALSDSFYLDFISTTLDDYLAHNPTCAACAYKNRCGGGCRGRAVDANGGSDLLDRDPDACLIFKGGYYDRVKKLIDAYEAAK
ncbi:MAG: radical SAM protein [Atopobiaceae bacterium]|nr:radical SAM protein [Atopobiaceae bacterium]